MDKYILDTCYGLIILLPQNLRDKSSDTTPCCESNRPTLLWSETDARTLNQSWIKYWGEKFARLQKMLYLCTQHQEQYPKG